MQPIHPTYSRSTTFTSEGLINTFSPEILFHIFSYCHSNTRQAASIVNRTWRVCAQEVQRKDIQQNLKKLLNELIAHLPTIKYFPLINHLKELYTQLKEINPFQIFNQEMLVECLVNQLYLHVIKQKCPELKRDLNKLISQQPNDEFAYNQFKLDVIELLKDLLFISERISKICIEEEKGWVFDLRYSEETKILYQSVMYLHYLAGKLTRQNYIRFACEIPNSLSEGTAKQYILYNINAELYEKFEIAWKQRDWKSSGQMIALMSPGIHKDCALSNCIQYYLNKGALNKALDLIPSISSTLQKQIFSDRIAHLQSLPI